MAINTEAFEEVIDAISSSRHDKGFHMRDFVGDSQTGCGTTYCIAGWMEMVYAKHHGMIERYNPAYSDSFLWVDGRIPADEGRVIREWFGISEEAYDAMAYARNRARPRFDETLPKHAVQVIRNVMAGVDPQNIWDDWEDAPEIEKPYRTIEEIIGWGNAS